MAGEPPDSVSALLRDWARVEPGMDLSATGVVVRLGRIRAQIEAQLGELYQAHGLSAADFAALSILRRAGETPMSGLAEGLYLTAGTVTPRVRRLVGAGLATVRRDPQDSRVQLVAMTPEGRSAFDRVVGGHLEIQRHSLTALTADEQVLLAELLTRVLADLESRRPDGMP
ncbi:MAG: MarR family transcriptional regulator [Actinobacteria bacterium]|nr:MAG: MarR family transcriptional regulator [Actinomycetota bacterium]